MMTGLLKLLMTKPGGIIKQTNIFEEELEALTTGMMERN